MLTMKRFALFIIPLMVIGSAGMVAAQQKSANISFEKTQHDFGKVKEEAGTVSYDFVFTNTGNEPLVISQVVASCGCTSPDWSKQPVPPGGKGFIKVTYTTTNRPGQFNKSVTVISNSSNPQTALWIQGDVIPKVKTMEDIYPYKMGDIRLKSNHMAFTKVFKGQQSTLLMEFINTSQNPVNIAFLKVPAHITMKAPSTIKAGETGVIEATYDADKKDDWGFSIDRIQMVINGEAVEKAFLTISASIEEDFSGLTAEELARAPVASFNETVFNFGNIKQNTSVEHEFVFTNTGKSDLVIRKVNSSCGCTVVKPKDNVIRPGESSSVKAVYNSGKYSGRQNKAITIITNDPKSPQIILRVTGNVESEGS